MFDTYFNNWGNFAYQPSSVVTEMGRRSLAVVGEEEEANSV